jgi:hypothetical protein
LVGIWRETGEEPSALKRRPELRPYLTSIWNAFLALSGDRQVGAAGSVQRIPFTAIDRYAERYGIDNGDEFERFHALMSRLDAAYLQWAATKMEKS